MNENEELLFEYPIIEERELYLNDLKVRQKRINRLKISVIIVSFLAMIMFLLSAIIPKCSLAFYFLTVIFVLSAVAISKFLSNQKLHYLFITADETSLKLEFHLPNEHKSFEISYQNINDIRFSDKTFTSIKITYYEQNQKEQLAISLNEKSPEQGFFLYTAPQFLPCPAINYKIVEKKFGDCEEYYQQIYQSEV